MTDLKLIQYHHRRMDYYDPDTSEYKQAQQNFIKLVKKIRNEKNDFLNEKISDYPRPTNKETKKFEWKDIKLPKLDYKFLIP